MTKNFGQENLPMIGFTEYRHGTTIGAIGLCNANSVIVSIKRESVEQDVKTENLIVTGGIAQDVKMFGSKMKKRV